MRKLSFQNLALLLAIGLSGVNSGCSSDASVVAYPRDPEFYQRFLNPAETAKDADKNLGSLQLLHTRQGYRMRFALFTGGTLYYQVDKLGDGQGKWKITKGVLELTAARPVFDMKLFVSAQKSTGDATVVRYYDRFGFNSFPIELRIGALDSRTESTPLPEFEISGRGL